MLDHRTMTPASNSFDRPYWEDRYGAPGFTWSGNPNPVLVTEVTSMNPGRALDVGSGEGGDALWLAQQGWNVTGVDIATNALDKARERAESVDAAAASRITWEQRDLLAWSPEPGSFDLVSAQFMHLAEPGRSTLFRALAAAVAPGGTLLVVGHDPSGMELDEHQADLHDRMFTADDVVAAIEGSLRIDVAESRLREADEAHTHAGMVRDVVVRATRPGSTLRGSTSGR